MGYEQLGVNQLTNRAAGAATDFGVRLFKKGLDKLKHRKHDAEAKDDNLGDVRNQSYGKPSESANTRRTPEEIYKEKEQQVKSAFSQVDEMLHGKQSSLRQLSTTELFDVINDRQTPNEIRYTASLMFGWCADNGQQTVKEEDLGAVAKYATKFALLRSKFEQ